MFAIIFEGSPNEPGKAEPLFYVDNPNVIRSYVAILADRVDGGAGIVPDVALRQDATDVGSATTVSADA